MKTLHIVVALAFTIGVGASAQAAGSPISVDQSTVPASTAYRVVDHGANHNVWQNETYEKTPDGQIRTHLHQFTELASGLNYLKNGQYVESQEKIESFSGGAVARQGQHQVIFANNLNTAGAIDMQTPDGKRLRSNILGLMYYDPSTGDAVQIAQVQDSEGELISDNQVLYPNAFDGVKADVRYTYRRDGLEQDVILREQPPTPEVYGLNSQTTELEVFTDFIDPPVANVTQVTSDEQGLDQDQQVAWGATVLGRGKAFNLGSQDSTATVTKRYVTIQGRQFLLEKVLLRDIKAPLSTLPEQAANTHRLPGLASKHPVLPKAPLVQANARPIRMALATSPDKGYVLDYVTLSASYTNYTFQGDTTYYISGNLNVYGTNTFEGGTVIKYAANASITEAPLTTSAFSPQVVFKTMAYLPVVFTAKDDNTVGESLSGSSGSPSGYYASPALSVSGINTQQWSGIRISYAKTAISVPGTPLTLNNAQFVKCGSGVAVSGSPLAVNNALFVNVNTNFALWGSETVVAANQVTFNNAQLLASPATNYPTDSYLLLTNCVLANVTNVSGTIYGGYNGFYRTPMLGDSAVTNACYPFQSAGAGGYYLTNGCAFVDAGTTNVDAKALALIGNRTTVVPLVYSNLTLSTNMTLGVLATRDTNTPDLGYHYDPLDYVFGNVTDNANLTFSAGTAVGWFVMSSSAGYGIMEYNGTTIAFNGTATAPCQYVRYNNVQEGGTGVWALHGWLAGIAGAGSGSVYPQVSARFTFCCSQSGVDNMFRDYYFPLIIKANNCEFHSSQVGGYIASEIMTNCLFDRHGILISQGQPGTAEYYCNCTFHGGSVSLTPNQANIPIAVLDSAFDGTSFSISGYGANTNYASYNHNAYTNSSNPFPFGGNNVQVTNFNWQSSWFGYYYLPSGSPLIDAGSTTADQVGLYHFTTQTNQTSETNSVVDIGYHYVAVDASGNPLDSNGDGIPDYLEDSNGNGIFDAGDLAAWQPDICGDGSITFTNGLRLLILEPKPVSVIP
jgi:hypothetical protein